MGPTMTSSPDRGQSQQFPSSLANQGGSFYNLTLSDFQNHLPQPAIDLKVSELLMNSHHIQAPSSSSSSSSSGTVPPFPMNSNLDCLKTIDEVWDGHIRKEEPDENYATVGRTTLESFLIVAGCINPSYPVLQQQPKWYEMDEEKHQQQQESMTMLGSSLPMLGNVNANAGFAESQQLVGMPTKMNRNDEGVDKSIERRQKRMIKNRESAARSRARKQAYINELEEEVGQLTDTNKRLKRQKEEEMLSRSNSVLQQRYQLRRTSSAPL